jgi:mono/diheme cytochrome c family protein
MIIASPGIKSIRDSRILIWKFHQSNCERPLKIGTAFFITCVLFFLPSWALAKALPSTTDMPESIMVRGKTVALKQLKNPLRQDPASLEKHIREGGKVYFKKCFLCHGDLMDGKGLFGDRFFPPPGDFTSPASVITMPESYAYWRIMKGGPGLPDKFSPWDSSMPAWEDQLSEEEVWKVILFIYATANEYIKPTDLPSSQKPTLERGKQVYAKKCSWCHGETGKGDGPSAAYSSPWPRNFTKSHIKIRSTPFGKIPTDQDIFDMISNGLPGTTMPGWKHLPVSDRWSLVLYLKSLGKKFAKFKKKGKVHKPIFVPDPPPFTLESLASGKELFVQNCSGCHGVKGRSDGASTRKVVDLASDAIWPRNLSKPWTFRRGNLRRQLFMTLRTGLSTTAMPQFSKRIFEDQQIWDLVHYVQTLSPPKKPVIKKTLKVKKVSGELSLNPKDPIWNTAESFFFPLGGQILEKEKLYYPTVDNISVKAIHNGDEIAINLYWDDPSYDPVLAVLTKVKESPPPPLPEHLRTDEEPEPIQQTQPEPQEFADAIAVQFPVSLNTTGQKPYFLNGDSEHPVSLWKWESNRNKTSEMNATGLDQWRLKPEESQGVVSESAYHYGRYYLVMKRKLTTADKNNNIQLQQGVKIPIAFNVWDGTQGESGTKKAISSWFEMVLETHQAPETEPELP